MTRADEIRAAFALRARLRAIAARDLADRTITPGEALDLLELIAATDDALNIVARRREGFADQPHLHPRNAEEIALDEAVAHWKDVRSHV